MFTGIIEETGQVAEISTSGDFSNIRIRGGQILNGVRVGDSIAVNGVCLTVRAVDSDSFRAELSRETLQRTSLKGLSPGAAVNLERPMRADGRFGGHLVQGHVDGLGHIHSFDRDGDNWNLRIEFPQAAARWTSRRRSRGSSSTRATISTPRGTASAGEPDSAWRRSIFPTRQTIRTSRRRSFGPETPTGRRRCTAW